MSRYMDGFKWKYNDEFTWKCRYGVMVWVWAVPFFYEELYDNAPARLVLELDLMVSEKRLCDLLGDQF